MNVFWTYLLQIAITAATSLAIVAYFRPHLRRVLVDLCDTEERAQFWVVFSSIILVGVPLIFGMGYNPLESDPGKLFFDAASQVRINLIGLLLALFGIGLFVSFFALVAPRPAAK
jgi:undecaprenyl pyrophosphate phosphatase UppP